MFAVPFTVSLGMFSIFLCVVPLTDLMPQSWGSLFLRLPWAPRVGDMFVELVGALSYLRPGSGLSGWFARRPGLRVTVCARASRNVKTKATIDTQNITIKNSGMDLRLSDTERRKRGSGK